ncbi:hypothetical protein K469DRAFT_701377, partial [Zopfia rhizophila CBS 207.26]
MPSVSSILTCMPNGLGQPPQPAVVTYHWNNANAGLECNLPANSSHRRLASLSLERFTLQRFDAQESANFRTYCGSRD